MNKVLLLILLALPLAFSTLIYTVETDRSGFSSVTLSTEGGQETNVLLPDDATDFRIVGGSYALEGDSAAIVPGQSGFTTFSFTSHLFTTKTGSGWKLSFSPPSDAIIRVLMPPYAVIGYSSPQPKTVTAEDSRTLIESEYSEVVNIQYTLEEMPEPVSDQDQSPYLLTAAIIVLAAILIFFIRPVLSKQTSAVETAHEPTLAMTPGKKEMMETFNENDLKIVEYLISNDGRSRRHELERKSGISKSSLATALNRLEKRKIIEMDRTATTHFVKLSDYFLKL